jgi:predicted RNase H-like nuclease (RuvC/YqgF family)
MDWKEAAGVIIGGVALLLPAIKWLISDWAKKAEELETIKSRNTSKSLERFEEDLKGFRTTVSSVQAELRDLSTKLLDNKSRVIGLEEKLSEAKRIIEAHSLNLEGNIRQLIRTELVKISQDAALIRDKKNGKP